MQRTPRRFAYYGVIENLGIRAKVFAGCFAAIAVAVFCCQILWLGEHAEALHVQFQAEHCYAPLPLGDVRQPIAQVDARDEQVRRLISVLLRDSVANQSSSSLQRARRNRTALPSVIDVHAHNQWTWDTWGNGSLSKAAAAHMSFAPVLGFPAPNAMGPQYVLQGASSASTVDSLAVASLAPGAAAAAKLETGKERAYRVSECTGDILAMSLYAVGSGLKFAAAVNDLVQEIDPEPVDPALRARDIFALVRVASTIVQYGAQASKACGKRKAECTRKIGDMVKHISTVAEVTALLANRCGPTPSRRFACGQTLERLAWQIGPFGGDITAIIRVCERPPDYGTPNRDYGQCAGFLVTAVGYVAAGGLQLSGTEGVCDVRNGGNAAVCASRIFSALRALTLAGEKSTRGAEKCGGGDTLCGRDLTLMSAALLGAGEAASSAAARCRPGRLTLEEGARCVEKVGALTKELLVVSAKAIDAANSCKGTDAANVACSSNIVKFLAGLAFISEQLARVTYHCVPPFALERGLYECARDIQRIGSAADVVSRGIGGTVADCSLGGKDRASKVIRLPRRFFTG